MDSKKADAAIANDFYRCYICQKLSECSEKVFIQSNMLLELLYVSWSGDFRLLICKSERVPNGPVIF